MNVSVIIRVFSVELKIDQLPSGDATIQITVTDETEPVNKYIGANLVFRSKRVIRP